MTDLGVNAHLLQVPGGRWRLNTPSLIVDLDLLEENIARMARLCRDRAIELRPHAKTHKSIEIARRQLAAGAVGICCAKLGEAEVLAAGGIGSILITSPVVTAEGCRRLAALNRLCRDLIVVTDSEANATDLSGAAAASGRPLKVVIDVDVGQHRTGIAPGAGAIALAGTIAAAPGLGLAGIQGYAGHLMHVHDRREREAATLAVMAVLAGTRAAIEEQGLPCPIVTGGGTGTFDLDPAAAVLTDLQAGSYIFMDAQYDDVWETGGERAPFRTSLFVQTTVISAPLPGSATTDAGLKAFATDAGPPRIVGGAPEGTLYLFGGDEQGGLDYGGQNALEVGATITCAVPHCDPTVNLYDLYHVVRGDTLIDIWPVDAAAARNDAEARGGESLMLDRRSFLLGSAATMALLPVARLAPAVPVTRRVAAAGLSAPVEIIDDPYGVPHIRARSIPDAFFGQGYVVARDRLFQIDLAHRRELGRLAEAFGADFAAHDAAARLFLFRGDLDAELAAVPAHLVECARAYAAGINARIDEVLADPALLPLEYAILGVTPLKWDVRDMVLARGGSFGSVEDEVRRARLAAMGLLDLDAVIAPLRPAWDLAVPEGLDAAAVSEADFGVLRLGGLPFGALVPAPDPSSPSAAAAARANAGSNAWTVGPGRSATGRPILANDPHLGIGSFDPRHVAHLSAPGLDVIGGGAPGLPGIMQGHTDRFAFGRTNFHIDQEDLFVLELHPDDPERYRHGGGWRRFERVEISIPVKSAPPRAATLRYAVQGPVVSHDPARRRATALSAIELQPGASGAFAMIAINLARDWASLRAAAFRFHPSPTNFHYADVDGNHGWQVIGFAPVRRRGAGLMPVPGDGRYDWTGMRDFRALPSDYNPAKGWFASANQNNLPPGWPRDRIPAFSFREPYRYQRIADVLSAQPRHRLADSVALQHDTLSTPARQLIALLPGRGSAGAEPALAMLRGWDGRVDAASGPAALFEILWRELGARMLAAIVPEQARALVDEIAPSVLLGLLGRPDRRLGADPAAARDALFDAALAAAWTGAREQLGPDPAAWRWGALHQVRIRHPLSRIPAIAAAFPPIEGEGSGGDSYTVMARGSRGAPAWQVASGASYLQVIDVGAWDNSLMLNFPGQSNDPRSAHYRDQYAHWIGGEMQPMLFSRAAVDARATGRTLLRP